MSKRPELTAAERALPYAKFYDLPITPIPEEKLAVLAAGPIDPSLALRTATTCSSPAICPARSVTASCPTAPASWPTAPRCPA